MVNKNISGKENPLIKYPIIRLYHHRPKFKLSRKLLDKGGRTVITCETQKGVVFIGYTDCWKMESYKKIKGKSIAFGRLMLAMSTIIKSEYNKEIEAKVRAQIGKIDEKLFQNAKLGIKPVDPVKIYTNGEKS